METVQRCIRADLSLKQRLELKNDRFLLYKHEHTLTDHEMLILSYWFNKYENLKRAYQAKEHFYNIYNAQSKNVAYDLYESWENLIVDNIKYAYQPLLTALENWHNEIFNYFDYRYTNAYTESVNSVLRYINNHGRGYKFKTLRAKILSRSINNTHKPKLEKKIGTNTKDEDFILYNLVA